MRIIISLLVFTFYLNWAFSQTLSNLKMVEKSIEFNKERTQLSIQYLRERHGIIQTNASIVPKMIVLHYTAGGSIKSVFNYFNNTLIEDARKLNKDQSVLNVSAHYLIDRDGTVYHLLADTVLARHTIGLNYCAIGVENIGSKEQPLTKEQVMANANLVRNLCAKYKIDYLIGHSEYIKFRNTKLWKETNPKYITYKDDPGNLFLIEVRKLISDLKLKDKY